jgi:DNA-binding response OmpR family regulator
MERKFSLLLIEDEPAIYTGLIDLFIFHGYQVEHTPDGEAGLQLALNGKHDLIVLDIMLPNRNGFDVCNEIRQQNRETPIIMLTAKSSEDDIIRGLSHGADDYVSKPFSVRELTLRVGNLLKRTDKAKRAQDSLRVGPWTIDVRNLYGVSEDTRIEFTRREIDILDYLAIHKRPVPRSELLEHVWQYSGSAHIDTRTVDIHIAKLRKKIERNPKHPELLITVRGEGYKINREVEEE